MVLAACPSLMLSVDGWVQGNGSAIDFLSMQHLLQEIAE